MKYQYVKAFKNNKFVSFDNICTLLIENLLIKGLVKQIITIINSFLQLSYFPNYWKISKVVLIFKSGKITPTLRICILYDYSVIVKLAEVILRRLINFTQNILHEQFGFKSNMSYCYAAKITGFVQ